MRPKPFSIYDTTSVVDSIMMRAYTPPDFGNTEWERIVYTPMQYVNRTSLNGVGLYSLSNEGLHYHPRSRRYNPRWAAKKRAILRGTYET